MKALATALACLLGAPCAFAEQAQQVYRCGQTYQQSPCDQGKAVDVADPRSESQRREAQSVTRDQARLGTALERERLAREKAARPAVAVGIGSRPAPPGGAPSAPKKSGKHRKKPQAGVRETEDFVAVEPIRPRPSKRAAEPR